jgi:hydrogenase maturation protease
MMRTLVLGFGNLDRRDDGVAFEVINGLRRRLGQAPLAEGAPGPEGPLGLEGPGGSVAAVFLPQLGPELVDEAAAYDQVVFVDAHVQPELADLDWAQVQPEFTSQAFSHHLTPQTFLAWVQALYQRQPAGHIVSVRGHDFDFGRGLSPAAAAQVDPAVERILRLAAGPGSGNQPS